MQTFLRTPFQVWNYTKMFAFIIATKKELLLSLLENVDEEKLMINEVVRNANLLNEAIRTSFKMKKKKQKQKKKEDVWNQSNEAIQIIKKINFY